MFCDVISADKDKEFIDFSFRLGYSKLFSKTELNIVYGINDLVNRNAVENPKVDILLDCHKSNKKIKLNTIESGFNQVLAKLAFKNKVALGFSFNSLFNSDDYPKLRQNIKLCRKYKVPIVCLSLANNKYEMRAVNDMMSLLKIIGMTPGEARFAFTYLEKR